VEDMCYEILTIRLAEACACGLAYRTSERGAKGDCVKEGRREEGERERERAWGMRRLRLNNEKTSQPTQGWANAHLQYRALNYLRAFNRCRHLPLRSTPRVGIRGGYEMYRGQPLAPARGSFTLIGCTQNARRVWIRWYLASFCLLLQYPIQSCARGEGGSWRACAMRYDDPRLVWTSLTTTH
jgi:hypothetical protein